MFKNRNPYHILWWSAFAFLVVLYFLTAKVPLFGDAHSKSIRASWFFDHHFSQWVIPTEISAGHPPLWELLIALTWQVFDRALEYSRLLLLLFNLLMFWQLIRFMKDNKGPLVPVLALFVVLIEPTLLAQTTFVNNDMMLWFFTLLGLNSIYRNQKIAYSIALSGVLFSNLRGVSVFASLALLDVAFSWFRLKKNDQKLLWQSYFAPVLLFAGFLTYHYQLLGWVLRVPNHAHREVASSGWMFHNVMAIAKNTLDYGRVFIFGLGSILIVRLFWRKKWTDVSVENKRLLLSFATFFGVFSALFIVMTNPIGPRYYLIAYLIFTLLCVNLIFEEIRQKRIQKYLIGFMSVVFITGHFWIWPATISQGWDSTLVHLAYFPMRDQMETYLEENHFDKEEIGTRLVLNSRQFIDLKEPASTRYADWDLEKNKFVLFSNIDNETSDEDIIELREKWILVQTYERFGVFVSLYKNPKFGAQPSK